MRASTGLGLAICCSAVTFSYATLAHADPLGAGGSLMLSADRLSGLSFSKMRTEDGGSNDVTTQSRTDVAFLWRPTVIVSPYTIPQLGLDVGVAGGFTVGGAFGIFSQSGSNENEPAGGAASTSRDSPSITAFLLAPRVGYGISILPWLAFWGRLGVTYYNLHSSSTSTGNNPTTTTSTTSGLGLNVDPMFVFVPVSHFGITAGPYLDVPLSGSNSSETTGGGGASVSPPDDTVKFTSFGLKAGLLGAFL